MKKIFLILMIGFVFACHSNKPENKFVGDWIEIMPVNKDIVQGMSLKEDGTASSIGMATLLYEAWRVEDNQLILQGKSIGNGQTIEFTDILDILDITPDSMALGKFGKYRVDYKKSRP